MPQAHSVFTQLCALFLVVENAPCELLLRVESDGRWFLRVREFGCEDAYHGHGLTPEAAGREALRKLREHADRLLEVARARRDVLEAAQLASLATEES